MNYEDILYMDKHDLRDNFKFIGQGAGRAVYAIDDNYVVKVSKGKDGVYQCKVEYKIFTNENSDISRYLCPIIFYGNDRIIMKRTVPLSHVLGRRDLNIFECTNIKHGGNLHKGIKRLVKKYNLLYNDLIAVSSWGLDGSTPYIIDYGCTRNIYYKYYE